jgi:phenylpropionate dioxygenase-like ring-hydroxylating dioxygenase large terminal subunit
MPPFHPDLVQEGRVHRRCYVDPDVFAEEQTRVFGRTWVYLGHETEVPAPGDWKAASMGVRRVLLARTAGGGLAAVLDRCAHRGARLTDGECGRAARFTCPYHGWSYANDGPLLAVPFPDAYGPTFDRGALGLHRVRTEVYRGFAFGTVDPDAVPLVEHLGHARPWLDEYLDRNPGRGVRVLPGVLRHTFAGNWKLSWDNAADGLHATFAHRSYNRLGASTDTETVLARDPGRTGMYGKDLGHGHMVVDQRPGLPGGAWASMRPVPFAEEHTATLVDRVGEERAAALLELATGTMVNLSLFPNLLFVGNQLMVVEPLAVDRTRLSLFLVAGEGAPPEVDQLRPRVEEDFTAFGVPDDLDMFERVQDGLSRAPEVEWVDVSRGLGAGCDHLDAEGRPTGPITSEAPTRGYLREYRRLMGAGDGPVPAASSS